MGGERQEREDGWRALGVSVSISGGKERKELVLNGPDPYLRRTRGDDPPPAQLFPAAAFVDFCSHGNK